MSIIKTSDYEGGSDCPICLVSFREDDDIFLIKHINNETKKTEKIKYSRHRKHIFHKHCMLEYIDSLHKDQEKVECLCPLDRERITTLVSVKYCDITALNILTFANNYYELINKLEKSYIPYISFIDSVNVNYRDNYGKTLIYCACQRQKVNMVRRLIKFGADATISDKNKFTPLMAAVCHGNMSLVRLLLKQPKVVSNINYVDKSNMSAVDYATKNMEFGCLLEILKATKAENFDSDHLRKVLRHCELSKLEHQKRNIQKPHLIAVINRIYRYLGIKKTRKKLNRIGCVKRKKFIPEISDSPNMVLDVDENHAIYASRNELEESRDTYYDISPEELSVIKSMKKLNVDLLYQWRG